MKPIEYHCIAVTPAGGMTTEGVPRKKLADTGLRNDVRPRLSVNVIVAKYPVVLTGMDARNVPIVVMQNLPKLTGSLNATRVGLYTVRG
jgi:hypothetical protein